MSVEYRDDRKKWGYRFYLFGQCFKKYAWDTKTEAKEAEREAQVEAKKSPRLQPAALITASGAYLIASVEDGRSRWRINYTFKAHIVPYFGEATLITDIIQRSVETLVTALKKKGLKNKFVKNIVTDLRAMLHWAMIPQKDGARGFGERSNNPVEGSF